VANSGKLLPFKEILNKSVKFARTNTLAYFSRSSATKKKVLMALTPADRGVGGVGLDDAELVVQVAVSQVLNVGVC
jgi:hypothetical protein